MIELVSPLLGAGNLPVFGAAVAAHLQERGEGMAALMLAADDPAAAAQTLAAEGLPVQLDGVFGGPEAMVFGTRFVIVPRENRKARL